MLPLPGPPFDVCLRDAQPHGVLVGVALPVDPEPVPELVLARLLPAEQEHARALRGFKQVQWVGGRLAAQRAVRMLGLEPQALMSDGHGAPAVAPHQGLSLSIAHKRDMAVALVARARNGAVGVDLEDLSPPRMRVAERVLTPDELAVVQALPEERQWTAVVVRFSLKEAVYKALAPTLRRYIDFQEAEVLPMPDGCARVHLRLARGEPAPRVEARYSWLPGRVLSTVRARWPSAT
ncbi:4'-phosphopantetheinyl transferase superfamily protein [Myxococcota bacterium]|nr:4'-phosphopantetheinyl transferase superfamily protein [Myxococcota bacterium]